MLSGRLQPANHASDPAPPEGRIELWSAWWWARAQACRRGDEAERVAAVQGFVLTRRQARECGLTDATIRRRVRRGIWCVPRRGVLGVVAVPDPAPGDYSATRLAERRRLALACAAAALINPGQTVSGGCAAVLHGLPVRHDPSAPQLTTVPVAKSSEVLRSATQGYRAAALVRAARLLPAEVGSWFGVPVTTPARTLVDLARHSRHDALVAADAALHEGLLQAADLDLALGRATGWPGVRRARGVLALASELAESPLESLARLAVHDSGLPMPQLQAELDAFGSVYRVDMIWPEQRVILELDGRLKYSADELWREKLRHEHLVRLGYTVLRATWFDIEHDWPATLARIRHALGLAMPAFPTV
jgi:hypothetical protein